MKLFFDTETTGVPRNYQAPVSDVDNWPRLVQLGYIVVNNGEIVHQNEYIVKPDGFEVPEGGSNVHGITTERALREGVNLVGVLGEFSYWVNQCDTIVGHNVSFDLSVVGCEYFRLSTESPFTGKSIVDTMKSSTNFCQIPGGYGKYKWPKLSELYFKLFGEPMGTAHTALQDISNTVKCYNALVERGIV